MAGLHQQLDGVAGPLLLEPTFSSSDKNDFSREERQEKANLKGGNPPAICPKDRVGGTSVRVCGGDYFFMGNSANTL